MDRIDAMKVFIAALDEGSLAVASRRLKPSPTAVSRALAFLEPHVGGIAAGYVAGQNVENQRASPSANFAARHAILELSLYHRRSDARIVKNVFATSGVSVCQSSARAVRL